MRLEEVSCQDCWPFILIDSHIEGITLGAGEEVDEVAGEAGGMGVDGIGEVGDWASEGQVTRFCSRLSYIDRSHE